MSIGEVSVGMITKSARFAAREMASGSPGGVSMMVYSAAGA
ncbi:hypothetical protein [Parenemella sanctibonifatiensis]|nr:hypothetical protein [Parenemella sanctibonifatiensis]